MGISLIEEIEVSVISEALAKLRGTKATAKNDASLKFLNNLKVKYTSCKNNVIDNLEICTNENNIQLSQGIGGSTGSHQFFVDGADGDNINNYEMYDDEDYDWGEDSTEEYTDEAYIYEEQYGNTEEDYEYEEQVDEYDFEVGIEDKDSLVSNTDDTPEQEVYNNQKEIVGDLLGDEEWDGDDLMEQEEINTHIDIDFDADEWEDDGFDEHTEIDNEIIDLDDEDWEDEYDEQDTSILKDTTIEIKDNIENEDDWDIDDFEDIENKEVINADSINLDDEDWEDFEEFEKEIKDNSSLTSSNVKESLNILEIKTKENTQQQADVKIGLHEPSKTVMTEEEINKLISDRLKESLGILKESSNVSKESGKEKIEKEDIAKIIREVTKETLNEILDEKKLSSVKATNSVKESSKVPSNNTKESSKVVKVDSNKPLNNGVNKKESYDMNKVKNDSPKVSSNVQKVSSSAQKEVIKPKIDYNVLELEVLWKYVNKFMVINGVKHKPVSCELVEAEFGARNVVKLVRKNYLLKRGTGYTMGLH